MKRRIGFRTVVLFTAIVLVSLTVGAGAVQNEKKFRLWDDCDPATFNAVLGDGACIGNGHTTFEAFIGELEETQVAHAWRNQPKASTVNVGRPTVIENRGGETHTFTPVANFGGGFVVELNGISGNPVPAPECLNFAAITFIPAGSTENGPVAGSSDLPIGTTRFQCCIHPWMRTVIEVHAPGGQGNQSNAAEGHQGHH